MFIEKLSIEHCRIISQLSIDLSSNFNLILGPNGSGKTSLLEAISLLATGRSFRSRSIHSVVQNSRNSTIVHAKLLDCDGYRKSIGVERGKDIQRIRVNNQPVYQLSVLAEQLPLQIITPESINLVMGSPSGRRSFIDWGLFHVEHQFFPLIKRYKKTINQRNALLRKGNFSKMEMMFWNQQLIECGELITSIRKSYISEIINLYKIVIADTVTGLSDLEIEFEYRQGWKSELSLAEAIDKSLDRERIVGHTVVGPHEADLLIKCSHGRAKQTLSRGQAKLLSISLFLAQLTHLDEIRKKRAVVLVDDLFSELDRDNSEMIFYYLLKSNHQIFATSTDTRIESVKDGSIKLFHVEHGEIREEVLGKSREESLS
jgi:DNA replication and repair protein RecF